VRPVNEDKEEVGYKFDEPNELTHAHAVTIHCSPGTASCKALRWSLSSGVMQASPTARTVKTRPGSGLLHYP
jgi:hypothetical protein